MKKGIILLSILLFLIATYFTLSPILKAKTSNSKTVEGFVTKIYEAGEKDINFTLYGDNAYYYINRGLESGLQLNELKENLEGKRVNIAYAKHFSLLNLQNKHRHIYALNIGDQNIYSEY